MLKQASPLSDSRRRRLPKPAARLIDDLLDLSSIKVGKLKLAVDVVDMHELVLHVVEMLDDEIKSKGLSIDVDFGVDDPHVRADPVRMHQVVWNVLRNAVEFTPNAGHIRLHSELQGSALMLSCTDDGLASSGMH